MLLFHLVWSQPDYTLIIVDHLPVVLVRVQRLVAGFVTFNSLLEVQDGFGLVAVAVVWTRDLHFLLRTVGGGGAKRKG